MDLYLEEVTSTSSVINNLKRKSASNLSSKKNILLRELAGDVSIII